jgi:hypothetical protein
MIRMAREAARDALPAMPAAEPEPPAAVPKAPPPVSAPIQRLLAARRRYQDRPAAPTPLGWPPQEIPRNARALAVVLLAIGLLGLGIVILIAAVAATP